MLPSLLLPQSARAAGPERPRVVVEIDVKADAELKARLTRRLIALELDDVDVPPAPGEPDASQARTLFVRVIGGEPGRLRVELWEQGVFHGARRVTAKPGTGQYLRARRIALAAAELARRARRRRLAAARRLAREQEREARLAAEARAASAPPRLALRTELGAALVGPGDLWLTGPALAAEMRFSSGFSAALGMAWLAGGAPGVSDSSGARWLEVSLTPRYALPIRPKLDLELGGTAAAAAVHLTHVVSVDDVEGQLDTWSARVSSHLALGFELSPTLRLHAGPEAGVVLRRMVVRDTDGGRHRLGGLWLGLRVGIALDPGHPTQATPAGERAVSSRDSRTAHRRENAAARPSPRADSSAP